MRVDDYLKFGWKLCVNYTGKLASNKYVNVHGKIMQNYSVNLERDHKWLDSQFEVE
jgi:hypothetical protein